MSLHTTFVVKGTEDVRTPRFGDTSRSIAIETLSIAVGGASTTPADLRAQSIVMAKLGDAAIEAAHWLENRACDLEVEQPQLVGAS